jgi:hypothetical protein
MPQEKPPMEGKPQGRKRGNQLMDDKQKEQLKKVQIDALKMIHHERSRDGVIKRLQQGQPAKTLSDMTLQLLDRVENQMGKMDDMVRLHAVVILLAELIKLGESAKIFNNLPQEERTKAFARVVQEYTKRKLQSGEVKPEQMQQAVQKMQGGKPQGMPPKQGVPNG